MSLWENIVDIYDISKLRDLNNESNFLKAVVTHSGEEYALTFDLISGQGDLQPTHFTRIELQHKKMSELSKGWT